MYEGMDKLRPKIDESSSISREEVEFKKSSEVVTISALEVKKEQRWFEKVSDNLTDDVYLTLDLDALDPAIMPAVGTPEPGGLNWYETIMFLRMISRKKRIIAFDMVELTPQSGNVAPNFLAAKLMYKIMGYIAESHGWI